MISRIQELKSCIQQIRKCQSWIQKADTGPEGVKIVEDLDKLVDRLADIIEKEAA